MGQRFEIRRDGSRILLTGDMRAVDAKAICTFLERLPVGSYVVEARSATIDPPAVTVWIEAVNTSLSDAHYLGYQDSQLAMILEDDERYTHRHSSFADPYSVSERRSGEFSVLR